MEAKNQISDQMKYPLLRKFTLKHRLPNKQHCPLSVQITAN